MSKDVVIMNVEFHIYILCITKELSFQVNLNHPRGDKPKILIWEAFPKRENFLENYPR